MRSAPTGPTPSNDSRPPIPTGQPASVGQRLAGGFPFTAVVGMSDLQLALILAAVSPAIGGVLIRGEKGTAKSTAVRALTEILPAVDVIENCRFSCDPTTPDPTCPDAPHTPPAASTPHAASATDASQATLAAGARPAASAADGPDAVPAADRSGTNASAAGAFPAAISRPARLVELPVGATEDRVLGSLHLERALSEGVTVYEPGLLAAAHRGILYVDEVNLLHDHLVDVLLDAAAMGRATVERDGVSITHPARFVLVGTMNPEEGELRPQLLDRFGLTVDVVASRDPAVRVEVMRARLAYEADPAAFINRYAGAQAELSERIVKAQSRLADVILTDAALRQIAEICASFDVDGMRADLVTARTAVAHAAWSGRTVVEVEDVRAAAKLALPHRKRRNPFDAPGLDDEQLEQAILNSTPPDQDPDDDPDGGSDGGPDGGPDGGTPNPDGTPPTHTDRTPPTDANRTPPTDANGTPLADTDRAPNTDTEADRPDATQPPTNASDPDMSATPGSALPGPAPTGQIAASSEPYKARLLSVQSTGAGVAGRRSRALTEIGRVVGDRPRIGREPGRPHLLATIRAAAPHQHTRNNTAPGNTAPARSASGTTAPDEGGPARTAPGSTGSGDAGPARADVARSTVSSPAPGEGGATCGAPRSIGSGDAGAVRADADRSVPGSTGSDRFGSGRTSSGRGGLVVRAADVRLAVREGREGNLVLFCVDASGSMGTKKRMGEVKTAIVSLLLDAYQRRDTVGLVTFAGAEATVALPPTGSVETAVRRLESLPTGGRTPLAEGLLKASDVLRIAAIRDPRRRPLLVLVTDGRATAGDKAFAKAKQAAGWLAQQGIASVVVDCEPRRGVRLGLAGELAADLGAEYLDLGEVAAGNLVRAVTDRSAA